MFAIRTVEDLLPGDVGFTTIPGRLGAWVSLGQALLRDECWFTHTYVALGDGTIVEAMPRGARRVRLEDSGRCGPGFGWVRLPLTETQRAAIGPAAIERVGTPYSFLDYLSLGLLHLGLPRKVVASRVTDSGHMICSQLVDTVLTMAGYHLFTDGRLPQDVTPGALFRHAGAAGQVSWQVSKNMV